MAVTRHSGLPNGRGERDAQHHKDRVRRQIQEYLKKHIGGEDIVTGEGRVKVPVQGNKRYRFILDRGPGGAGRSGPGKGAGEDVGVEEYEVWLDMAEVEELLFAELDLPRLKPKKEVDAETSDYRFNDIARKGPQVDKRATLRRNLLRNAAQGRAQLGEFDRDDLRYVSFRDKPRPKSKAVVMLMMDVSGSMGEHEKRIARLFFYWIVRFLHYRYDTVDVVFISHTTEAREVTEHEFFNRKESGGTKVSSAYRLANEIQAQRYPESDWNVYVLHASDGDNWQMDNQDVFDSVAQLCRVCALVGYLEVKHPTWDQYGKSWETLIDTLAGHPDKLGPEFMLAEVAAESDIWRVVKRFFARDDVEAAVAS
jgi:sporulation protein YhbH